VYYREVPLYSTVDEILDKLAIGHVTFATPVRLLWAQETVVSARVYGGATPAAVIERELELAEDRREAEILVSNRMEAQLVGSGFKITSLSPTTQAVTAGAPTEWRWAVVAERPGSQQVHLSLFVIVSVDGVLTPRAVKVFDRAIDVEITAKQRIADFIATSWQWLMGAIVLPFALWAGRAAWRRWRKSDK
jgi:hypothetical protein